MSQDAQELWAQCLLNIERRVRAQSFNTWFRPTTARRFDADVLEIEVSSSYFAHFVESNYLPLIISVVEEETRLSPEVTFAVADDATASRVPEASTDPPRSPSPTIPETTGAQVPGPEAAAPNLDGPLLYMPLNERYLFETFVVGEGNRFAHAASQGAAKSPGKTQFNPLVIYGGVGLGKTHLLQAIGHYALSKEAGLRVVYVPSEKFMGDFIESLRQQNASEFQRLYRSADVLLVDDIQFLIRGEQTQNEFFHTFNALHQNSKQIVMTCDSPPAELKGLEERLISRFQWGLVTSIEPPDLETRIAILQKKAEINGIHLPDEVATFLGNYISSNIRELEGTLNHLMAYCAVNQVELSVDASRRIVQERSTQESSQVSIEGIQKMVAKHFDLTLELLIGKTRKHNVASPRQIAMYLVKRHTKSPLKVIGLHFGNRDHSTVVHAVQTVDKKCGEDPAFARVVQSLSEEIQRQAPQ
ncbi:MAG TPA: chromosomal replication initiator protein DnaA [Candidatus Latescibacteria bacterium]|jgi:chromosomal replication initiator protein|nr:chromosomal replication initiator protein DnaA [Gemmatimonadaceae bacterium]MDP6014873.1 chromosomal replication initiator protein DnaA [Candidatus Latescibacterota bacterium]HJP33772.1 chromosomal replication initiator protein DnaA [Candidatus Latescibacterota bacterium]|tara:strand:+ start:1901 stop:3319 length:1419 start_codon:yes stop_codon:yes gene_type:complete